MITSVEEKKIDNNPRRWQCLVLQTLLCASLHKKLKHAYSLILSLNTPSHCRLLSAHSHEIHFYYDILSQWHTDTQQFICISLKWIWLKLTIFFLYISNNNLNNKHSTTQLNHPNSFHLNWRSFFRFVLFRCK